MYLPNLACPTSSLWCYTRQSRGELSRSATSLKPLLTLAITQLRPQRHVNSNYVAISCPRHRSVLIQHDASQFKPFFRKPQTFMELISQFWPPSSLTCTARIARANNIHVVTAKTKLLCIEICTVPQLSALQEHWTRAYLHCRVTPSQTSVAPLTHHSAAVLLRT